jgi:magnesium transporter
LRPADLFPQAAPQAVAFQELILKADDSTRTAAQIRELAERFQLHSITAADLLQRNQRSKIELFESYLFIVWHHYCPGCATPTELHFIVTTNNVFLVASRPPQGWPSWRKYLLEESEPCFLRPLVLRILYKLVSSAQEFVDELVIMTQDLELRIFENSISPREILELRALARNFAHTVGQAKEVITETSDTFGFHGDDRLMYRKLIDHFSRMNSSHEQLLLQVIALFDVYWGQAGLQTNMELKRLSLIATLALPVAMWGGVFGMNFQAMPFHATWFFVLGLSLMVTTFVIIFLYLRNRGLIARRLSLRGKPEQLQRG